MRTKGLSRLNMYVILSISAAAIAGCVLLSLSLVYGFSISIIVSMLIFMHRGFRLRELSSMIISGVLEYRVLYVLILMIGVTVSVWMGSGVVPSMIYYGFEYLKEMNFILAAFLIVSISSVFMGTAVGTISTVGIAILGIGRGLGIPTAVLLGAIVSGAFIADKISPISGLLNLSLNATGTDYKQAFGSMLKTLIPSLLISSIIYYFLGTQYIAGIDMTRISELQAGMKEAFFISPYLLLMPLIIVVISSFGVQTIYSILAGLSGGVIISLTLQGMSMGEMLKAVFFGYKAATASTMLNQLLISGGVLSMVEVLMIVIGAIALSSLLEGTGIINGVTGSIVASIRNKGELIINTGLISGALTMLTCDQTMGIVLPGRLLRDKYEELNVDRGIFARTISDTGTIIAPLMPWNINSLIIAMIMGASIPF
ncbi:MAG: Na+/H+ antiporter NhaC, partial [Clostridia bacterium]|nr:Na+/H+ antiporter NhaC [Clostridia bacterium]